MLNTQGIAAAFTGLVGWRPATEGNPEGPLQVLPAQLNSRSGLFVNDVNELLALSVLVDAVPEGETLAAWIARLTADALLRLSGRIAAAQGLDGAVLLRDQALLPGPGHATDTVNKQGRFVGLRIRLARKRGVTYLVPRLSIQLDAVQTTPLLIYVYSSTSPEPVKVILLPANTNRPNYPYRYELEDENALDLSFAAEPGEWAYVGYYENDLTGRAINRGGIGASCGCSADPYPIYSPYVHVRGVAVRTGDWAPDRTGFLPEVAYEETSNFGLDLQFTGFCDTSAALRAPENQLRLQEVVQMALAVRFLEALVATPNLTQLTQREAVQTDAYALLTLYQARLYGGKDPGTDTFYPALLSSVVLDLSELDTACKPQPASLLGMGTLVR